MIQKFLLPISLIILLILSSFVPNNNNSAMQEQMKQNEDMILVEGGTFSMGSDNEDVDARPAHKVTLKSFYIDKFEITNKQYCTFLNSLPNREPDEVESYIVIDEEIMQFIGGRYRPVQGFENKPVIEVTYDGATAYAKWAGKRLPTEAEWEYAAKGGKMSKSFKYSGSNIAKEVAWYNIPLGEAHPVGQKKPNELGIYDMTGNVWEWCSDWYNEKFYKTSVNENPVSDKPDKNESRVLRGGAYNCLEIDLRVIYRNSMKPDYSNTESGFRCAKSIQ